VGNSGARERTTQGGIIKLLLHILSLFQFQDLKLRVPWIVLEGSKDNIFRYQTVSLKKKIKPERGEVRERERERERETEREGKRPLFSPQTLRMVIHFCFL
jgi:hypothetical protein